VDLIDEAVQRYEAQLCERDMMETTVRTSVNLLLEVLATLNPASFELSQRLQGSVRLFARGQKLPNPWELELAAALSRIGLVALPGPISRKVAHDLPLTPPEAEIVASIPEMGANLLKQVPRMDRVAQAIRYQEKNFDGSGTPADTLARADIPLGGRVLRIFIDRALLEQDGISGADAQARLSAKRGVYDPALLEASFRQFPEYILSTISADRRIRLVDSDELRPGLLLVTEIRTAERLLLVASGTRLTPLMVQRIQTHVTLGTVTGPFGIQEPPAGEETVFEPELRAAV
jgi:response regulator RpfG family c-di-GMP phosphodiesterase